MGLFSKMKSVNQSQAGIYCDSCGRVVKPDEIMAVLAKSPSKSYYGVMELMINKWVKTSGGTIYCGECFENRYGQV